MINELLIVDDNDELKFDPNIRGLEPYRSLFIRDKGVKGDHDGRKKILTTKILSYIYFVYDPRSAMYKRYSDVDERKIHVKRRVGLDDEWQEDKLVQECIEYYKSDIHTEYTDLLNSVRESIDDLRSYYTSVSTKFNDVKFDMKKYFEGVNSLGELIEGVEKLKKKVINGIVKKSNIRGGGDMGYFEEPE